ncbi:hypothetical protein BP00DRAFT_389081 [Aspergillus indologenus CBS 114.80]|uniref:Zinc finger PHD-type domain-containing protein n=1 Tax=Aspergillus indologenus CBS 114.80 TaxID=1450541 RepID=A0A2V5ILQ7_9EURO|nr:hypothetical protein BP00DRAFT_389081 [Aspergillus indologenus CBS 114.80]
MAVRKTRSKRPTRGSDNRRVGLRTAHAETISEPPVGHSEAPPRISWPDTLAALEREPIASQIQRHKQWKRDGSIHETYCRVCFREKNLEPCLTCRLAFHTECLPTGWIRDTDHHMFCSVCVRRDWHISPPTLTPPASPRLTGVETSDAAPVASPALHHNTLSSTPLHHAELTQTKPPIISPLPEHSITPQPKPASDTTIASTQIPAPHPDPSPPPTRRNRKSRYTNLPADVDASLNVLYRELESNASLRLENEDLREENLRCQQIIQIRDLSLTALRRELEYRRSSEKEMETLRTTAAQLESSRKEVQELRARNEALEAELERSRQEAAEAREMVSDWKAKLSTLLGS